MTETKSVLGRRPPGKMEQLQYLLEWFQEYSSLQKEDFLLILRDKYAPGNPGTLSDSLRAVQLADRPVNIFQCRMKLFSEWFSSWSDEEKAELLLRLKMLDKSFMEKFEKGTSNSVTE
ncbi:uncharacterized protein C14orf119-like isoform X2 [Tachypleus tridentatus]